MVYLDPYAFKNSVLNGELFGNFPHIMEMLMIADKDMGGVRSELIF